MITNCPHCKKEIQISTKKLNEFGFVEGSKGDYVSKLFTSKGISLTEIITKTDEKFTNQNSIGRILRVINTMKNNHTLVQKDNLFCLTVKSSS